MTKYCRPARDGPDSYQQRLPKAVDSHNNNHQNPTTRHPVFLAFIAIAAAFLAYTAWLAYSDRERELHVAREKVAIGAVALEEQTSRAVGEIELLLDSFGGLCRAEEGELPEPLRRRAEVAVGSLPQLTFVALYDREANVLMAPAHAPAPGTRYDGFAAEHFEITPDRTKRSFIGLPFRAATDETLVPISVHVTSDDGALCGVAIAGLSSDYFIDFFRSFLGSQDGVALVRREQRGILARFPPRPEGPLNGERPPEPGHFGVQRVVSPIDGVTRLAAYRKSDRFPLVVRYALTEQAIIDQWLARTLRSTLPGLGVLLLLLGVSFWIEHLLSRARQRERQLVEANDGLAQARAAADEANLAKSRFLANMSHEIRTPLNTVVGIATLLRQSPLAVKQRDYVGKLGSASNHLLSLIDAILDLSKAEAGRLELEQVPVDLPALLRESVEQSAVAAHPKGLPVRLVLDETLPARMIGDPVRLRQVLSNLAGNAIRFTEQGEVSISARLLSRDHHHAEVRFEVSDSGIGIARDQLQHIFEVFHQADASTTRRFGGTGLGLAISRRIVRAMGGELEVSSTPGHGSRFWFSVRFPLAEGDAETTEGAPCPESALDGIKLLLVDDDALGREIQKDLLESVGAAVQTAETGADALARCVAGERFDLILMDVQTPEMDGLEATRRIRAETGQRTPIIGLSANALTGEAQRARAAGMDDYHTKPVDMSLLIATIRRHIPNTGNGSE